MGMLLDGKWIDQDVNMTGGKGAFQRPASTFRSAIGSSEFPAEPGRYHLFTGPSCPWAHRTVIARKLKRLEPFIAWSQADLPRDEGWTFSSGIDDLKPVDGKFHLHRLYTAASADFTGRVTVPVLWDRKKRTIVNNESAEILRMLNDAFKDVAEPSIDLYPARLRDEIDATNEFVYVNINNGVYRCGFAKSQEAYDEAFDTLFAPSPTRISGCLRPWCVSTPSITSTSNATGSGSRITTTSGTTSWTSFRRRASERPWICPASSSGIMPSNGTSIRPASCRAGQVWILPFRMTGTGFKANPREDKIDG
jgi:hypothetical protein